MEIDKESRNKFRRVAFFYFFFLLPGCRYCWRAARGERTGNRWVKLGALKDVEPKANGREFFFRLGETAERRLLGMYEHFFITYMERRKDMPNRVDDDD